MCAKVRTANCRDDTTEILVMGTMPSDISLAKREYCANPLNDFWRLVGAVLNRNVATMSYDDRPGVLKAHHIGLWDAYQDACGPEVWTVTSQNPD